MKESDIQRQILDYLKLKHIFAWRNNNAAIYSKSRDAWLKNPQKLLGVPDILGIYKSKFLGIEVKNTKGIISPEQEYFIERVRQEGGIAFVARSVEDVINYLKEYDLTQHG